MDAFRFGFFQALGWTAAALVVGLLLVLRAEWDRWVTAWLERKNFPK